MSMEDILKALVNSRQPQSASGQQQGDPMTQLIGGLLGGMQPGAAGSQGQDAMVELLGGLLGEAQPGGGQQQAGLGSMMSLLENIMGGGSQSNGMGASDPIMGLLQPFVAPLAKKANIPPEIAMVVVSFAVHKLLAHHPTSGRDSNTFDLDNLLQQMGSGRIDQNVLQNSGMARELSQKTGLDEAAAAQSLNLAFSMLGKSVSGTAGKRAGKTPARNSGRSGLSSASNRPRKTIKRS